MKPAVTLASELLQCLAHQQFERLVPHYAPAVKQVLTNDLLCKSWRGVISKTGRFQYVHDVKYDHPTVDIRCKCEKTDMKVTFSFDENNLVSGLVFGPNEPYKLPDYGLQDGISEENVTVGEGKWILPGKLTLPSGSGTHPCVILVHGSGALDEDETIGPNKPFKDIAYGLASRGIGTIRYTKRNLEYAKSITEEEIKEFTLIEECVEDSLAAVNLAASHPRINKERVFVMGHSLGGFACPLIAQRGGSTICGIISLAGNVRHLGDMILEQTKYLSTITGQFDAKQIDLIETAVQKAQSPSLSEETPKDQLLNISPKYWLFLQQYDPITVSRAIPQRMLILHAGRDYQVTKDDFELWKKIHDPDRETYKEFPTLNHLMMQCDPSVRDSISTPEEYNIRGNVDVEVINTVTQWINFT